jgi:hypothetical protein
LDACGGDRCEADGGRTGLAVGNSGYLCKGERFAVEKDFRMSHDLFL